MLHFALIDIRMTWIALLAGMPCVLLIAGAFVGVIVMLMRGKGRQ
jgi:hypothetical protein